VRGRTARLTAPAILACLTLSNCGAIAPVKYYRLDVVPASAPAGGSPYPVDLILGRISAPDLFRDDRLVYSTGPVEMGTYENQRWAEIPTEMIENMLLESLRSSGQYRSVQKLSSNARGDYILRGRLSALDEVDAPQVAARFRLELELFDRKSGTVVWTQSYAHDEPVSDKTVPAVVEAMQTIVRAGLQQLTESLSQYFASQATH
jgi:ABC-type uncharacterized transport system auxiliary subunit